MAGADYLLTGPNAEYLAAGPFTPGGGGGSTDVTTAVAGDALAKIREAADTQYRLIVGLDSDGQPHVLMGNLALDGSQPQDIQLKRIAPGLLQFQGSADDVPTFLLSAPFASGAFEVQRDGDGVPRARLREDSVLFGTGAALDSRVKRTAAKTLTIDDGNGGSATLNVIGTLSLNGVPVAGFAGAKVYASAHQVLTDTAFSFDSEEWDTDGYHEPVTHPTRITIPAGRAGKYLLVAGTFCTGTTRLEFHINGSPNAVRSTGGTISIAGYTDLTAVVDLAVGDYVEVLGNAGGARTYGDDTETGAKTSFSATLMAGGVGPAGPAGADGVSPTTIAAHGARVKRTANQSVGNNTLTAIAWTAEDFDTDAIHDNVTNNTRLTIPAIAGVTTGLWSIKASGYSDLAVTDLLLRINGVTSIAFQRNNNPADVSAVSVATEWVFTAGDYVEVLARTPTGAGNIAFDVGVSPIASIAFLGKVT